MVEAAIITKMKTKKIMKNQYLTGSVDLLWVLPLAGKTPADTAG